MKLEDLQPNAAIRGILPDALVTVVGVQWFGSEALELTYRPQPARWRTNCCIATTSHGWRLLNTVGRGVSTATAPVPPRLGSAAGVTAARRFHGTVALDLTRVGRDASRIADEVIAHLSGLVGAEVKVTLEIEAEIPSGASDQVVRTVTENSRTLKFTTQGFEKE